MWKQYEWGTVWEAGTRREALALRLSTALLRSRIGWVSMRGYLWQRRMGIG